MQRFGIVVLMLICGVYLMSSSTRWVAAQETGLSRSPSVQAQIVGGSNASRGEYPWLVYIKAGPFQCGGSLVAPNWVLTAGHCVLDSDGSQFTPAEIELVFGEHDIDSNDGTEEFRQAVDIVPFNYDINTNDRDLALIRLQSAVPLGNVISTISVATEADANLMVDGMMTDVAGWGATDEQGGTANVLQKVSLPLVKQQICNLANGDITENMICAGFGPGIFWQKKDACSGDSGGPLVVRDGNEWKQIGIVSWGIGCAREGKYGVYTRVSNFAKDINQIIGVGNPPTATPTSTFTSTPTPTNTPPPTPTSSTPTPTHTPSSSFTATPTFTSTPVEKIPGNGLLLNGDFEKLPHDEWNQISSNFGSGQGALIVRIKDYQEEVQVEARSGIYAAWLGGQDDEEGDLSQVVDIPDAASVFLVYHYEIRSRDNCGRDSVAVRVNSEIIKQIALCTATETSRWTKERVNISKFAGGPVTIGFHVITDGHNPQVEGHSNFFLDDIYLNFDEIVRPTETPTPPAVVPTPTPDILYNGSFEDVPNSDWIESSLKFPGPSPFITSIFAPLPQDISPLTGIYVAWLGGDNNEISSLSQSIDLPPNADTLVFHHRMISDDACGFDIGHIFVNDRSLMDVPLCTEFESEEWIPEHVDISEFAGSQVKLEFRLITDEEKLSHWFIDDVSVATIEIPQLIINPSSVTMQSSTGDNTDLTEIIRVDAGDNTSWSVTAGSASWLSASIDGHTTATGSGTFAITVNPSQLIEGKHEGTVLVQSGIVVVEVPVTIDVIAGVLTKSMVLKATSGASSIFTEWSVPNSVDIGAYRLSRRREDLAYEPIQVSDNVFFWDIDDNNVNDLHEGLEYCYQVEAYSNVSIPGAGAASGPALAVSDPVCATYGRFSLWIPQTVAMPDDKMSVPVNMVGADGLRIMHAELWIDYDSTVISVTGVAPSVASIDYAWSHEKVLLDGGLTRIKIRGLPNQPLQPPPIYGDGPLFYLNLNVVGQPDERSPLDFPKFSTAVDGSKITIRGGAGSEQEGHDVALDLGDGFVSVKENGQYMPGDVDGDAQISESDSIRALEFATGLDDANTAEMNAADVNGDGEIDAADATIILYRATSSQWPPLPPTGRHTATVPTQTFELILTDVSGQAGDLVPVAIDSANLNGFAGADLVLNYDPAIVAGVEGVTAGRQLDGFLVTINDSGNGQVFVSISGNREVEDFGRMAVLKLRLVPRKFSVTSKILLARAKLHDLNGMDPLWTGNKIRLTSSSLNVVGRGDRTYLPVIQQ